MTFNFALPELQPARLAVKLSVAGERSVRSGHPWIFSNSIIKVNKQGKPGDVAIIFGVKNNTVIGVGLYDPDSPIRIKMLHNGPAKPDREFFADRIARAYALRMPLLKTNTNSYRLIFGENDGLPGLIVDVYDSVLVVKLYSEIWYPYLQILLTELIALSEVKTVVLRLSRQLQKQQLDNLKDGAVLYGELDNEEVIFHEHGVLFSANVIKGHKTGYFLDHRHNRKRVGELAAGKRVLDVFAYAGGFSVHALAGGASEVISIDISEQALEMAQANAKLNSFSGTHRTIAGDAFKILNELIANGEQYDLVIIDPPSFAKSAKEIDRAKKKYRQLAALGASLTSQGGILVLASCSSRVTAEDFFGINQATLEESGRIFKILETTTHDIDHPVIFIEGAYLKTAYYRF